MVEDQRKAPEHWKSVGKSGGLTRRFEFQDYDATRIFLEQLAALSEETGIWPDIGFATTYVNVTISAPEGGDLEGESSFAERSNEIFGGQMK